MVEYTIPKYTKRSQKKEYENVDAIIFNMREKIDLENGNIYSPKYRQNFNIKLIEDGSRRRLKSYYKNSAPLTDLSKLDVLNNTPLINLSKEERESHKNSLEKVHKRDSGFNNYIKNSTTKQEIKDREIAKKDRLKAARSAFSSQDAIDLYGEKEKNGGEVLKQYTGKKNKNGSFSLKENAPVISREDAIYAHNLELNRNFIANNPMTDEGRATLAKRFAPDNAIAREKEANELEQINHDREMASKSAFNSEDAEKLYGKKFAGENRGEILPEYIGKKNKDGSFKLNKEAPIINSEEAHGIHQQEFRQPTYLRLNREFVANNPITDEEKAMLAKRYSTPPDNTRIEEWIQERKNTLRTSEAPVSPTELSSAENDATIGQRDRIEKLKREGLVNKSKRERLNGENSFLNYVKDTDSKLAATEEKELALKKNERLSKVVSKGEGFTQAELDQQTTDNLQKVLSGNTVEPLGEEGITATPKTRQVYGTQGQRVNGVLGVHKEEQVNKAKEFLKKNNVDYDSMSNQEIIAKRNEIRKSQLKDNISKIRTNRKVALGVGVAVTAGALVLGLSNSRGQQSNAQLYGQQPLSY